MDIITGKQVLPLMGDVLYVGILLLTVMVFTDMWKINILIKSFALLDVSKNMRT